MSFEPLTLPDLEKLKELQPEGWPDIITDIRFYLSSDFCYPYIVRTDSMITGTGTFIRMGNSAWLAHIITHPEFRRAGIGKRIVEELLKIAKENDIRSCSLIATPLGKNIYAQAGFREVCEYTFLKKEKAERIVEGLENLFPLQPQHLNEILRIDRLVTGEDREKLISSFFEGAYGYFKDGKILGYYLPSLKEGPVYALHPRAGEALLLKKMNHSDRIVLPSLNVSGIKFLKVCGFVDTAVQGTRMILGESLPWQPEMIYSRIGGNLG